MTDQSVFEKQEQESTEKQNEQETPVQSNASTDDVFANQLASIRNERGEPKYTSVEEALKGAAHAQEYIPQLKSDLDKVREDYEKLRVELDKRESVEEVVARLTAKKDPDEQVTPQQGGLDAETFEQLLEQKLTAREQANTYKTNVSSVQEQLKGMFGDKTQEIVNLKAKELGITPEEIGTLASKSPKMVLALFKEPSSKSQNVKTTFGGQKVPSDYAPKENELSKPAKSLLSGASSQDQAEYMRKIKEHVYKKLNVTV